MNHNQPQIIGQAQSNMDLLFGTGATRTEKAISILGALILPAVLIIKQTQQSLGWNSWQWMIAILVAADLGAGMVANALNSCKLYYHHTPALPSDSRIIRISKNHYLFAALHIYPLLIYGLFPGSNPVIGLFWYVLLLLSTALLFRFHLYLHRPVGMLILLGVIVVNGQFVPVVPGFSWLIPVLFIKILNNHSVREEPYRP